jgi:hypothetical protein
MGAKIRIDAEHMRALLESDDVAGALALLDVSGRAGRPDVWPWKSAEIGESFVMDGVKLESARVASCRASRRYNRLFRAMMTEKGIEVIRLE